MKHIHEQMVDALLIDPTLSARGLAEQFGYSVAQVNLILGSTVFQRRLHQCRTELINPLIIASTQDRLNAVLNKGLEVLNEKLHDEPSDQLALRAVEVSSKALGMGGVTNTVVMESDHLEVLAKRLVALRPVRKTSSAQVVDVYEADSNANG